MIRLPLAPAPHHPAVRATREGHVLEVTAIVDPGQRLAIATDDRDNLPGGI
jgi:hypothetical protein